ncbi:PTS transporter subunit EIIC [Aerococcus sp. UMB7834]|uniref:PTS transporter subunit EIIC n=1 Tax=Aerococcus sp. UMB7834 TaxID=3046342 RepID=UPI00254F9792|nr:PTS transporter subunit EIIC [Aerococcus sp. UMB7834]MDK6804410.1 PTS transporter subunit EIIC [Aerococcus sp. UMB7834]
MSETQEELSFLDKVLNAIKEIFAPILIGLTAAGILQGITILLHSFSLIQEGKTEYIILNSISNAVFYFLPILLANSAAKVFGANQILAMATVAFLLHPEITSELANYDGSADFFGIPLPPGNYPSSVIPIILITFAQSYIEKFWYKVIPEIVRGVFAPVLVLLTTCILGISVLEPLGTVLGDGLVALVDFLSSRAEWLVPALLGGFGLFVVMFGAHYALFPVVTQTIAATGTDTFFNPGMLAANMALSGAVLAVFFKTKHSAYKQYNLSACVTAAMGVSQPGLYGVAIPIKSVLMASIVGGLAGGLYAGISQVYAFAFANPGIAALPIFISPDGDMSNLINCLISIAISFGVAFALVYFRPFTDLPDEDVNEIVAD